MICKLQSEQQPSEDWSRLGPSASEPVPARRALGHYPNNEDQSAGAPGGALADQNPYKALRRPASKLNTRTMSATTSSR